MTGRLNGMTALITGSDSGIGQATAIEFGKEGADVVVHYLNDHDGAQHTREQVEQAGRRAIVVQGDISDEHQVGAMFDDALAEFGALDVLMNDAGVDASGIPVIDLDTETWDKAIRTNVYGAFFCSRRFAQHRRDQGGKGKIINVTSVHQEVARAGGSDYDASKGALLNLSKSMALELAPMKISQQHWARDGPHAVQPEGNRRPEVPGGTGTEYSLAAGRPAQRDRSTRRLPGQRRGRVRDRLDLLHGWRPDAEPGPGRLSRSPGSPTGMAVRCFRFGCLPDP